MREDRKLVPLSDLVDRNPFLNAGKRGGIDIERSVTLNDAYEKAIKCGEKTGQFSGFSPRIETGDKITAIEIGTYSK